MKKINLFIIILISLLFIIACGEKETEKKTKGKPDLKELELALNVNAYSRDVSVKINGNQINFITGGLSQSTWLYHINHSYKKMLGEKKKELFCLKEGENRIDITHKLKDGESPTSLTITIGIRGKEKPLLIYKQSAEQVSGHAKGVFQYDPNHPEKFKQVIIK